MRHLWCVSCLLLCVTAVTAHANAPSTATAPVTHEYCIVGAGPAGVQAAYYLQRDGRDYSVFEKAGEPGTVFRVFPRHRTLLSINKRFTGSRDAENNLRHDWNSLLSSDPELFMTRYSTEYYPHADDFVRYIADYVSRWKLAIHFNTTVESVHRHRFAQRWPGELGFELRTTQGIKRCRTLLPGTGLSIPHYPPYPNYDAMVGYETMSLNASTYRNQRVLVLGNGNSAFEVAQAIANEAAFVHVVGRRQVRFAFMTHYAGDVRAINAEFMDHYMLKSLDAAFEGGEVPEVDAHGHLLPPFSLEYDHVIRCFGFKFDASMFAASTRPYRMAQKNGKYPAVDHAYQSPNVPGMYFIGPLAHGYKGDFGKSSGAFIHGFRYTVRALCRILAWRHHNVEWPHVTVPSGQLAEYLLRDRIGRTSALYQMFGVLSDVVVFHPGFAKVYHEVPVDYMMSASAGSRGIFAGGCTFGVLTLEYGSGFKGCKVLAFERVTSGAKNAHRSKFLHPVLRIYGSDMALLHVHHTVEDISVSWRSPHEHLRPLRLFLRHVVHNFVPISATSCPNLSVWSQAFAQSLASTPVDGARTRQ